MQEFQRINRLPPYVFNIVNELKAQQRAEGVDIIDFGMGNPDRATPQHIVDKLIEFEEKRLMKDAEVRKAERKKLMEEVSVK